MKPFSLLLTLEQCLTKDKCKACPKGMLEKRPLGHKNRKTIQPLNFKILDSHDPGGNVFLVVAVKNSSKGY